MKTLRITSMILLLAIVGLLGYANLRPLSPSEKLKQTTLVSFRLQGNLPAEKRVALEKQISQAPGVTACTISRDGNTASVIYYSQEVDVNTIVALFQRQSTLPLSKKNLASSPGCPVHAVEAIFTQLISTLDHRSR
jgi:hypothetical protein